jgi:hypothetical protein
MIFVDPARFFRPPYVGGRGRVGVCLDRSPDWAQVAAVVRTAYGLVAPARRRAALDGGTPAGVSPSRRRSPRARSGARRGRSAAR